MKIIRNISQSKDRMLLLLGIFVLCNFPTIIAMQLARPLPVHYNKSKITPESKELVIPSIKRSTFSPATRAMIMEEPKKIAAEKELLKIEKTPLQIQQEAQLKYIKEGLRADQAFVYQENTIKGVIVSKDTIMLCKNIVNKIGVEKIINETELTIPVPYPFEMIKNVFKKKQTVEDLSFLTIKRLIDFHNFIKNYLGMENNIFAYVIAKKIQSIISNLQSILKDINSVETDFPEEHTSRGLLFAIISSKNELIAIRNKLAKISYGDLDYLSSDLKAYLKDILQQLNQVKQAVESSLENKERIINKLEKEEQKLMPFLRRLLGA
jgi:hypothetical protein